MKGMLGSCKLLILMMMLHVHSQTDGWAKLIDTAANGVVSRRTAAVREFATGARLAPQVQVRER